MQEALSIRPARTDEFLAVRAFYHHLTDAMQDAAFPPGWEKDVYPAPAFLRQAIAEQGLFLGLAAGQIAACMVLDRAGNPGYDQVCWPTACAPGESLVIHALGVRPDFAGRGIAGQMVRKAIACARQAGLRAVRLDVLAGNIPAERLYVGQGFHYVDTVDMFYADTGRTAFRLYEYPIETT